MLSLRCRNLRHLKRSRRDLSSWRILRWHSGALCMSERKSSLGIQSSGGMYSVAYLMRARACVCLFVRLFYFVMGRVTRAAFATARIKSAVRRDVAVKTNHARDTLHRRPIRGKFHVVLCRVTHGPSLSVRSWHSLEVSMHKPHRRNVRKHDAIVPIALLSALLQRHRTAHFAICIVCATQHMHLLARVFTSQVYSRRNTVHAQSCLPNRLALSQTTLTLSRNIIAG